MKKVLLLCVFSFTLVFANTVTLLDLKQEGKDWKVEVNINPAVTIDKAIVNNEQNSSVVDFKTDIDTAIYFLIDTSIPMKKGFKKGILPLLSDMERIKQPKEKWIVSYFDNDLHVIYDDEKTNSDIVANILPLISVQGQRTELWRNTQVALKDLSQRVSPRKILVLLSDGDAEDTSAYTREDVITMANDAGIRIASLSYRDTIGTQNLRKISEETAGAFWKADKVSQQLTLDFYREFMRFVRSQGHVIVPSDLIHPTKTGKQDLNITLEHGVKISLLSITVDTEKIVPPKPKPTPKVKVKPIAATPVKSDMQVFFDKYKLYLAAAAVLLLLLLLFFLLRKKEEPILDEAEETIVNNAPEADEKTKVSPSVGLAYFESLDGKKYKIYKLPSNIGKSPSNDVIIDGQYISRQHATIFHKDGYYYITDNNSANGVKINGKKISTPERIENGIKVSFGPYETVFRTIGGGITPASAPEVNSEKTTWNR